jgi:hypothetical protein
MRGLVLALIATCALLSGCELVADFDRSKIDSGTRPGDDDASTMEEDATVVDPPDEDGGEEPADGDAGGEDDAG